MGIMEKLTDKKFENDKALAGKMAKAIAKEKAQDAKGTVAEVTAAVVLTVLAGLTAAWLWRRPASPGCSASSGTGTAACRSTASAARTRRGCAPRPSCCTRRGAWCAGITGRACTVPRSAPAPRGGCSSCCGGGSRTAPPPPPSCSPRALCSVLLAGWRIWYLATPLHPLPALCAAADAHPHPRARRTAARLAIEADRSRIEVGLPEDFIRDRPGAGGDHRGRSPSSSASRRPTPNWQLAGKRPMLVYTKSEPPPGAA